MGAEVGKPATWRDQKIISSWLLNFTLFGMKHFRTSDSEPPKIERLAWLTQNPATIPLVRHRLGPAV